MTRIRMGTIFKQDSNSLKRFCCFFYYCEEGEDVWEPQTERLGQSLGLHGAKRKEHMQILFANWIARIVRPNICNLVFKHCISYQLAMCRHVSLALQHACIFLSFSELIALHAPTLGGNVHSCTKLFNMLNIWRRWHAWRNALETTPHTSVFS